MISINTVFAYLYLVCVGGILGLSAPVIQNHFGGGVARLNQAKDQMRNAGQESISHQRDDNVRNAPVDMTLFEHQLRNEGDDGMGHQRGDYVNGKAIELNQPQDQFRYGGKKTMERMGNGMDNPSGIVRDTRSNNDRKVEGMFEEGKQQARKVHPSEVGGGINHQMGKEMNFLPGLVSSDAFKNMNDKVEQAVEDGRQQAKNMYDAGEKMYESAAQQVAFGVNGIIEGAEAINNPASMIYGSKRCGNLQGQQFNEDYNSSDGINQGTAIKEMKKVANPIDQLKSGVEGAGNQGRQV